MLLGTELVISYALETRPPELKCNLVVQKGLKHCQSVGSDREGSSVRNLRGLYMKQKCQAVIYIKQKCHVALEIEV